MFAPQPVAFRGLSFPSQRAAAQAFGRHESAVHHALRLGRIERFGLCPNRGRRVAQPCEWDGVAYPSVSAAAAALGVHVSTMSRRLRRGRV
jgi:IS30 family transposase